MKRLTRPTLVTLVVLAVGLGACADTATIADPVLVDASEAVTLIAETPDLVVLDVRTAPEVAEGVIADAIHIDWNSPDFADRVAGLDRDVPYLVYCRSGNRSQGAVATMADLGFTQIHELDGGVLAWLDAGGTITG